MARPPFIRTVKTAHAMQHVEVSVGSEWDRDGEVLVDMVPSGGFECVAAYLDREDVRAVRDHLDALLGEQRATIPPGFSGNSTPGVYLGAPR